MPDELLARVDRTAHATGKPAKLLIGELVAHFELKDQDYRAREARARMQQ